MVAATEEKNALQTIRGNLVFTVCRSLSLFLKNPFSCIYRSDQIFKAGNYVGS